MIRSLRRALLGCVLLLAGAELPAQQIAFTSDLLSYQGTYAAGTTYAAKAVVVYGGSSWVSLQAGNTGNTPANGSSFWGLLAAQGSAGINGTNGTNGTPGTNGTNGTNGTPGTAGQGFNFRGAWAASTAYNPYDVVTYGGSTYEASTAFTSGATFSASSWNVVAAQGQAGTPGTPGTAGSPGAAGAAGPQGNSGTVLYQSHPYTSTSYGNEFTTVGTAPPLDAFGRLQPNSTAGSETGMQSVIKTFTTNSENWIYDMTITVVGAPGSTSYGFVLAAKSVNPNAAQGMRLNYSINPGQTGGPQMSLATWTGAASGSTLASVSVTSNPSSGGKVRLIFARRGSTMYGIAQNLATGVVNALTWTDPLADASGSSILPNASQFTIADYGGTYTINNITITEDSAASPNLCILGDSKSDGVGSQGLRARFASLLDAYGPVDVFAGGGDGTPQVLASLPTVLAKNCKTVIVAAPFYNDLGWGTITASQSQQNYSTIVSTLKAAGVMVKHMLSIPATGSGAPSASAISSYNSWISSTFSNDTIVDPSVGFNTSTMLTSSGIHPNDAGHLQVAADIIAQGGLTAASNSANYLVPSPLALFGQP